MLGLNWYHWVLVVAFAVKDGMPPDAAYFAGSLLGSFAVIWALVRAYRWWAHEEHGHRPRPLDEEVRHG